MKSTLYLKFIILYIVFAFLSLFTVSTLSTHLFFRQEEERISLLLSKEADTLSTEYLPDYFTKKTAQTTILQRLDLTRAYINCSVWLTDPIGNMILSSDLKFTPAPKTIRYFDPNEVVSPNHLIGSYHDYFHEDFMTVISPVQSSSEIKGYVLLHYPLSLINNTVSKNMQTTYLTLLAIYILSFIILISFHFIVVRPLAIISNAARQYASGNLNYEIPINTHDEIGYLSASLNYMSSQIRDMEAYQKKFVANVSHDFRSPLTSIKGYLEALADGTIPPEQYDKYIGIILFETERLTELTNDLLTLNEFDTKELLLDRTVFDIQDIIRHTAYSFEGICRDKLMTISLLFLPNCISVYADQRKIEQVLYNLLDNAIKFSEKNSTVTIEVTAKNEKIYVSVKDDGIGIPRKEIGKIWERFYKSDLSRGKDKKGTGLGLAIVKEILNAHGEHINVISTEYVGTEFIFSLPKVRKF